MAFFITNAARTPDGGWAFTNKTKVRLTGPEGPLAQHILELPRSTHGQWNLDASEITAILPCSTPSDQETPLLLWDSNDPSYLPTRVVRFCGVSREFETELLVHMEILESVGDHVKGTRRQIHEALRLLGGYVTPQARWVLGAPQNVHWQHDCRAPLVGPLYNLRRYGTIRERAKPTRA